MKDTDFVLNGKDIVNDGVVIKVRLSKERVKKLLKKKLSERRCFY